MIAVQKGIRSEEVRHQAEHTLFVEGDENSIDVAVLNQLFQRSIRIAPLGPCYSIECVAKALFEHHPNYYFLMDRDHRDDSFVDDCWNTFPDPKKHNLLVWRRREIENYFLEPEYLSRSEYFSGDPEKLKRRILECAEKRLFLDVANHVIISIREKLKKNWIEHFKNPDDFPNKEKALKELKNAEEFGEHSEKVARAVSADALERRFDESLKRMTGGGKPLEFGTGDWLQGLSGKKVLSQLINSDCFKTPKDADAKEITGKKKLIEILKDLLKKEKPPEDFIALKKRIDERINGSA